MQSQTTRSSRYFPRPSIEAVLWVRWRHGWTISFLLLCTLLTLFFVQGFENGSVNNFRDQSVQFPIIYSYADSSLYAGDFLLEARGSYVTWFYPVLGMMSRFAPLDALMLSLYLLSILLTITAVYALAEILFPRRAVGLFAVTLWMAYFPNPGGDFTHSPFVTHSTLAIALDLWALVLTLRRRYTVAALVIGLTANINAMTSFFVGITWFFALLYERKDRFRQLIQGGVVMVLSALPILWWRFSLPLTEASPHEYQEVIRMRLWYAVFPFSISPQLWIGFGVLLVLWFYSFRYGKSKAHGQMLYMAAGIVSLCIVGTLFTEVFPLEFMIEMQPIRSAWVLNLFIMLYLAHMLQQLLTSPRLRHTLFAFLILGGFVIVRWWLELSPPHQPTPYSLYADLDILWTQSYPLLAAGVFIVVLAGLCAVVWRMTRCPQLSVDYLRRATAWIGFAVVGFAVPGFLPSQIPSEQRMITRTWEDTLIWIERHTPKEALFVTPPTLDGFRVWAKRAQIGDWKDGTIGIFYNGWAIEWYHRMLALGFDPKTFSFQPMTQARLCATAAHYHADYTVVFRRDGIQGEPVFQNERFQVLPIEKLDCSMDHGNPSFHQSLFSVRD